MNIQTKKTHDINNDIETLKDSLDIIKNNWQNNPELLDQIIPLMKEKFLNLENLLSNSKKDI